VNDEPRGAAPREGRGRSAALAAVTAYARDAAAGRGAVVLVEGRSDRAAVEALAARRGRDLRAERIFTVPMGGATNLGHFLDLLGPRGRAVRLAGLCDAAEAPGFRRSLERAGLAAPAVAPGDRPSAVAPAGLPAALAAADPLERLGFFVCVADLEDELIRSLGPARVEQVVAAQGELGPLRTFRQQPAQRERPLEQQLRRFMGTRSGRKIQYARALAEALDPARIPEPLDRLLAFV
jgi:hypothetical protein